MDLSGIKSIAGKLAEIGLPAIAGSVLGPGGALAVHSLLVALGLGADSTPEQALAALGSLSGDQLVKMKELDAQVAQTQMQTAAAQVESVNKTLQTEAMGGSFWQRNHHSFECTLFILFVVGVYFVLPILKIQVPTIPEFAFMAVGAVLGVTSWQRGQANIAAAKASGD